MGESFKCKLLASISCYIQSNRENTKLAYLEMLVFEEREKPENPEKNLSE